MNPLDAFLAQLDADPAPLTEHEVADALQGHEGKFAELKDADRKSARSDFVAFRFVGRLEGRSQWGTRFGPCASGTNTDGSPFEIPPLSNITSDAVQHWRLRASTLRHPVLAARYADLAWDLARLAHVAPQKGDAELAVDQYLKSAIGSNRPDLHERLTAAVRAFDIAAQIKDAARTASARTTILDLHQQTLTGKVGWWWIAPKRLLRDNRTGLKHVEEAALIASLEALATRFSDDTDPTSFDPHQHESAADYLITHYRRNGLEQDVKRLMEAVARTFEAAANLATPMLASTFLRKSADSFQAAGIKDEHARVRIALESALKASKNEMTPVEVGTEIKADDMQQFVDRVVDENLANTLVRIAARLLRSRTSLEEALQKEAKAAPLQAMIEIEIIENDRVVGVVGPLKDDLQGRLVRASEMHSAFSDPWLMECLDRAIEVHQLHPTLLAAWINRHGLFEDPRFLIQGRERGFPRTMPPPYTCWFHKSKARCAPLRLH